MRQRTWLPWPLIMCLGIRGEGKVNGKQAKAVRRQVRKGQKAMIRDFLKTVDGFSFKGRLRLAWAILRGKA